jgi:hypothetical protein
MTLEKMGMEIEFINMVKVLFQIKTHKRQSVSMGALPIPLKWNKR